MKNIRLTFGLAALLIASSVAMAVPASAVDGSDDSTSNTTTSTDDTVPNKLVGIHDRQELTEQLKEQAKEKVEAQRQAVKQKTAAERQKACTARKNNLTKRMTNAVSWANKHKGVIDTAYTRVKTFHDTKNLDVTDYDTLTAAVDTAQASAQTSVDALKLLDVSVDCSSQTVATTVSTFQQAVKNTRDSLKAYRTALVKLISSIKGASTGAQDETTNSTGQ